MKKQYVIGLGVCVAIGLAFHLSFVAQTNVQHTAQIRKLSEDLLKYQTLAAFMREFLPLIKDEYSIRGITIPGKLAREVAQRTIDASFNAAAIGRTVIRIVTEQAPVIKEIIHCSQQSDAALRAAAGLPPVGANTGAPAEVSVAPPAPPNPALAQCPKVTCTTRRQCTARLLYELSSIMSELFNQAVVKFDPQTGMAYEGFLMNVDFVVEKILQALLENKKVQEYLKSKTFTVKEKGVPKTVDGLVRTQQLLQMFDSMRTMGTFIAEAVSGGLNAVVLLAAMMDPSVLPQDQRAAIEENLDPSEKLEDKDLEGLYEEAAKIRGL